MSIGKVVRKVLGTKRFANVARSYRSFFLDIKKLTTTLDAIIPSNAKILDIGGGDGEVINQILTIRKDLKVTMIDLSPVIGNSLSSSVRARVKILPETSVKDLENRNDIEFNTVIISDVIHHIPPTMRENFFLDIRSVCSLANHPVLIIIKDVQPGTLVSYMGYFSDRFISGDKNVSLTAQSELQNQLSSVFNPQKFNNTKLLEIDSPNYAFYFTFKSS
jgi:cyclopropane fatty-acyl-phospholipid synthase-like methyltransferase